MIQTDHRAVQTHVLVPAEGGGSLDGHARAHVGGHDALLVLVGLGLEQLKGRHGDHARLDALGLEQLLRAHALFHFGTTGHEQHVGRAFAVGEDVAALEGVRAALFVEGQILTGEYQRHRGIAGHGGDPARGHFLAVGGAEHGQARHGAQAGQLLDGLMGGAVLADADGIVGEDVGHVQTHDGRHAHGVLHVIAEHEEGGAVGAQTAVQADAVADGRHGVFAHAEVDVVSLGRLGGEIALALHVALVGGREVGGAAKEVGHALGEAVEDDAGGIAGRALALEGPEILVVEKVDRQFVREPHVPFLLQFGILLCVLAEQLVPFLLRFRAAAGGLAGLFVDAGGHGEGLALGPAEVLLGRLEVLLAQRFAVDACLTGLGGAVADGGVADDEVGLVRILGQTDGGVHFLEAVAVLDVDDVPAIGAEAGGHVLAEGDVGVALDGDLVVVIQGDELVELQGAGQRAGLVGDALHHAAVAEDAVGVVVDHVEALAVELGRQMLFGHGHAHGVGDALTQRAGGGLNAHGVLVLGVAGGLGAELTEGLEVVDGQAVAEQVQKGVQQHRAVAGGKHEAVAVDELGIGGVVDHLTAPQGVGHGGRAHRHAGVAGLGLLHGLGAENADGVDDHLFLVHGEHLLYRLCWSLRYE